MDDDNGILIDCSNGLYQGITAVPRVEIVAVTSDAFDGDVPNTRLSQAIGNDDIVCQV